MRAAAALTLSITLIGCGKDASEFELDEKSFDEDTIHLLEDATGFDIPDGATGLKFYYIPPIDPIYFAKIQIPEDSLEMIKKQIAALTTAQNFPDNFGDDRCTWWPPTLKNVVVSKKSNPTGFYLEVHLIEEAGSLILYLKYFTV